MGEDESSASRRRDHSQRDQCLRLYRRSLRSRKPINNTQRPSRGPGDFLCFADPY
jgi:hypothetical protein